MKSKKVVSIVTLITFLALGYLWYFFHNVLAKLFPGSANDDLRVSILNYALVIIALAVTAILFKNLPFSYLGLGGGFLKGLCISFLFVLPMFIGYGYPMHFDSLLSLKLLHRDLVLAGFFEEFMFRGFAFGLLFYYAGWGFIPAILVPSLLFGAGHLYQADTFSEGIAIFCFTAIGSAGFSWFYVAWGNLWVVIFLHGFMNLAWDMYAINSDVTGDLHSNLFRFATLIVVIIFSVKNVKRNKKYSLKGKLWINRERSEEYLVPIQNPTQ